MDFSNLNTSDVNVSIVTIGGVNEVVAHEGMTIAEFKSNNGLAGKTIIDEEGNRLADTDVVREGLQVYVSVPKQNG